MNKKPVSLLANASWTNIVMGIWVIISPFVLGFSPNPEAMWNNITVGVACLAVAFASEWWDEGLQALVVPLGTWLFMSPFVLGFSRAAFVWNNVMMAFLVIGAGLISEGLRLPDTSRTSPHPGSA